MRKKANRPLTILANSPKLSGVMIVSGIIFGALSNVLVMYGAYYKGLNSGVEARDDYYYKKEMKAYEESRNKADS